MIIYTYMYINDYTYIYIYIHNMYISIQYRRSTSFGIILSPKDCQDMRGAVVMATLSQVKCGTHCRMGPSSNINGGLMGFNGILWDFMVV